jgi:hypothetical protein
MENSTAPFFEKFASPPAKPLACVQGGRLAIWAMADKIGMHFVRCRAMGINAKRSALRHVAKVFLLTLLFAR